MQEHKAQRQHEWQPARRQWLGQILLYLAQNPLGLLGELQWITLSLMICRYTESGGPEPPPGLEFISWT